MVLPGTSRSVGRLGLSVKISLNWQCQVPTVTYFVSRGQVGSLLIYSARAFLFQCSTTTTYRNIAFPETYCSTQTTGRLLKDNAHLAIFRVNSTFHTISQVWNLGIMQTILILDKLLSPLCTVPNTTIFLPSHNNSDITLSTVSVWYVTQWCYVACQR